MDIWEDFLNFLNLLTIIPAICVGYEAYKTHSLVAALLGAILLFGGMAVINPAIATEDWLSLNVGHLAAANLFFFTLLGFIYGWGWFILAFIFLVLVEYFYTTQNRTKDKKGGQIARQKRRWWN